MPVHLFVEDCNVTLLYGDITAGGRHKLLLVPHSIASTALHDLLQGPVIARLYLQYVGAQAASAASKRIVLLCICICRLVTGTKPFS